MIDFGIEYELADFNTQQKLAPCFNLDDKDYTIVNSDGTANDPKHKKNIYGGELTTIPGNIEEQLEYFKQLPKDSTINYRCNLHVHIKDTELLESEVDAYITYSKRSQDLIALFFDDVASLDFEFIGDDRVCQKRANHSKQSHRNLLSSKQKERMYSANTKEEFFDSEYPVDKNGRLVKIIPRSCINMRPLQTIGTIEYRLFWGVENIKSLEAVLLFVKYFHDLCMHYSKAKELALLCWVSKYADILPKPKPIYSELEESYQRTK